MNYYWNNNDNDNNDNKFQPDIIIDQALWLARSQVGSKDNDIVDDNIGRRHTIKRDTQATYFFSCGKEVPGPRPTGLRNISPSSNTRPVIKCSQQAAIGSSLKPVDDIHLINNSRASPDILQYKGR